MRPGRVSVWMDECLVINWLGSRVRCSSESFVAWSGLLQRLCGPFTWRLWWRVRFEMQGIYSWVMGGVWCMRMAGCFCRARHDAEP